MTAREIYERYQLPPWLRLHQLRVAAVGKMAAEAQAVPVDVSLIVSTCLVHDIGAIVKFDFSTREEKLRALCPPEEIPHWIAVQADMHKRYGTKEYPASKAILEELGLERVLAVFTRMGLANVKDVLEKDERHVQIAQYGDMRVGPTGIFPLKARMQDVMDRYTEYWRQDGRGNEMGDYPMLMETLEARIFEGARIRPEDITDASVAPLIEELWDWEVA